MIDLSIDQLVQITGGCLRMAALPPLGGLCEPVRRITVDSSRVESGDVFWELPRHNFECAAGAATHALMRAALGVVTTVADLEPFPGAFSLHVADPARALRNLVRWWRGTYRGRVVELLGGAETDRTAQLIAAALMWEKNQTTQIIQPGTDPASVLEALAHDEQADCTIVNQPHSGISAGSENSILCCPDIVAITCSPIGRLENAPNLEAVVSSVRHRFDAIADGTVVILDADDPALCWASIACPASIYWIGSNADLELAVRHVATDRGSCEFVVEGCPVRIENRTRVPVNTLMTALAITTLLGLVPAVAAAALSEQLARVSQPALAVIA